MRTYRYGQIGQLFVFWLAGLILAPFLANATVPTMDEFSKKEMKIGDKPAEGWQVQPVFGEKDTVPKPNKEPSMAEKGDAETPSIVVMSAELLNLFYLRVDNPLRIAAIGFLPEDLRVNLVGNGSIEGSAPDFLVRVTSNQNVTIEVFGKKNGVERLLERKVFRCKRIPDPVTGSGSCPSGDISVADIQKTSGVRALLTILPINRIDLDFEIVGYTFVYLKKRSDSVEFKVEGADYPEKIQDLIKTLEPGDTIFIDDIRGKIPGDTGPRNLGGLFYKII